MFLSFVFLFQGTVSEVSQGVFCGGIALVLVIVLIVVMVNKGGEKARKQGEELAIAKNKYLSSLGKLRQNPSSEQFKKETIALGKIYSNQTLVIDKKYEVKILQESDLMNDINAACASMPSVSPQVKTESEQTIELRLKKLSELKGKSLINEQEYSERRQKILDEI